MKKTILIIIILILIIGGIFIYSNNNEQTKFICKRAAILHTETCNQDDESEYCSGAGYNKGDIITYGSKGNKGILKSGDAFDCDVNGDGKYDSKTERFYYVTDLKENSDYAVLIYYNNVKEGTPNNDIGIEYNSSNLNNDGPITAITYLPTTNDWKNVKLHKSIRNITNQNGENTTEGILLNQKFSYEGYSARFLTIQEVQKACDIDDVLTIGELDSCQYLLENTKFANSSIDINGYWLENVVDVFSDSAFDIYGGYRNINYDVVNENNDGVRPVIEVKKTDISY